VIAVAGKIPAGKISPRPFPAVLTSVALLSNQPQAPERSSAYHFAGYSLASRDQQQNSTHPMNTDSALVGPRMIGNVEESPVSASTATALTETASQAETYQINRVQPNSEIPVIDSTFRKPSTVHTSERIILGREIRSGTQILERIVTPQTASEHEQRQPTSHSNQSKNIGTRPVTTRQEQGEITGRIDQFGDTPKTAATR